MRHRQFLITELELKEVLDHLKKLSIESALRPWTILTSLPVVGGDDDGGDPTTTKE